MDWEAEWDSLSNDSWVAEKNLAGTLRKIVREFRKSWDFILYNITLVL